MTALYLDKKTNLMWVRVADKVVLPKGEELVLNGGAVSLLLTPETMTPNSVQVLKTYRANKKFVTVYERVNENGEIECDLRPYTPYDSSMVLIVDENDPEAVTKTNAITDAATEFSNLVPADDGGSDEDDGSPK